VLYIAFLGVFSGQQIIAIGITNYIYKFSIAILLTPLIYMGHYLIDRYLGKENAQRLSEEAAKESNSFL
jgi:queuosine precursor transporter